MQEEKGGGESFDFRFRLLPSAPVATDGSLLSQESIPECVLGLGRCCRNEISKVDRDDDSRVESPSRGDTGVPMTRVFHDALLGFEIHPGQAIPLAATASPDRS